MKMKIATASACFVLLFSISQAGHAEKMLSGNEIKALVSGKTVHVTKGSSTKWRIYHAPNGSAEVDNGETSDWSVEGDKHCNSGAPLRCASIRDNGDGTYARLKPNGSPGVVWTKIVDGKDFK
jgi:hypothetical protein